VFKIAELREEELRAKVLGDLALTFVVLREDRKPGADPRRHCPRSTIGQVHYVSLHSGGTTAFRGCRRDADPFSLLAARCTSSAAQ
jgi:hypothetical protein